MQAADLLPLGAVVLVLAFPLAREYRDLRRTLLLGRVQALATTLLVLPASLAGAALTAPLASRPAVQWTATVLFALLAYSFAVRAIVARASSPATAPSRRI